MTLIQALLEAGILQFGWFKGAEGVFQPLMWRFDLLPSYPHLLSAVVASFASKVQALDVDYLVCSHQALPLALGLSLSQSVPLVYSRGKGEAPTQDFVGAYDVGHPACFVDYLSTDHTAQWVDRGQNVGLEIRHWVCLFVMPRHAISSPTCQLIPLWTWDDLLNLLEAEQLIPQGQLQALRAWGG